MASSSTASPLLQSLSIPTHSTVSVPSPAHIVYNILVQTPTLTYTVSHRYSSFVDLSATLGPTPLPLPGKNSTSTWRLRTLIGVGTQLSELQLIERRTALEGWLRAILSSKEARWSSSKAFIEFLRPPAGKGVEGEKVIAFTPSSWTAEHALLATLSRNLKVEIGKRDVMIARGDSGAHATNAESRKGLVDLVVRIGALTKGLESLAKQGMPQGELHRRGQMLGVLQDQAENLGKSASVKPRLATGGATSGSASPQGVSPAARSALLGGPKAPSRVLGFSSSTPGSETKATRPLDNQGLLQLQDSYVAEQDTKLDALTAILRRQRELGMMIGGELDVQKDILDGLDRETDRVGGKLKEAGKQMKRLG